MDAEEIAAKSSSSKESSADEDECKVQDEDRPKDLPPIPAAFDISIESLFTEETLNKFGFGFAKGPLNLYRFTKVVKELLGLESDYAEYMVPNLFDAIDTYRRGFISFGDFCQYLYEDYQRRDMWKEELERIHFVVPGTVILPKVHRPPPIKLLEVEDIHLMFSKDGMVSYWSNAFKMRKCRSLKTREIEKERHYGKVYCDIAVAESLGKVIVSTSDKEIQFFDLQSLEPYCQIHGLPSCACSLDAKLCSEVLIIVFGDWHGGVNVLAIQNAPKALRSWAERPKVLGIGATSLEAAILRNQIMMARWKVHDRRVDKVIFTELLGGQIISCSTDTNTALSIGCAFPPFSEHVNSQSSNMSVPRRPAGEEHLYKIPFGVQTIDIWEEKRYFAASGVDRTIRVWSIMTKGDAIMTLRGHTAPIRQIKFFPPVLVSISSVKNIRIWDLKEFRCIVTVNAVTSKIRGQEVLFMHCSNISNVVLVQTSEDLYAFHLQKRVVDDEATATHSGAVVGGHYNDSLRVWITCSNKLVKIWDVRTGRKKSEFEVCVPSEALGEERINEELRFQADAAIRMRQNRAASTERRTNFIKTKKKYYPDFNKPNSITCMHAEKFGNRLLTGHANGVLQEFNFVSGMNIRTMYKSHDTKEGVFNSSINGVIYVKSALNDNILSVGWNKVIDVYLGGESKMTEPVTSWNCYRGHEDDIWCVTSTEPNILITGSYEGLVILWNFTSGKIEGRLLPPNYNPSVEYDMNKVTALCTYKPKVNPDDGCPVMYLFTAGPESGMHMWEIYWKVKIFFYRGRIRPWRSVTRYFCALAAAPERSTMIAADSLGDIYLFDMKVVEPMRGLKYNPRGYEFNLHLRELMPVQLPERPIQVLGVTTAGMPELVKTWQAHLRGIPVLSVCDRYGLILSGDTDGKARVWNFCGHYIGMLGQDEEWDIGNASTYVHPEVPRDIHGDFSREYEAELDKRFTHADLADESHGDVTAVHSVENLDDYIMSDAEIAEKAKNLPVYKKALPDFLKFESCHKVVYRNCTHKQKYSLTPVYKRMFDNDLLEQVPKKK